MQIIDPLVEEEREREDKVNCFPSVKIISIYFVYKSLLIHPDLQEEWSVENMKTFNRRRVTVFRVKVNISWCEGEKIEVDIVLPVTPDR